MQRNYLTEKENPYRYGVLQGNYVEEIYAKDLENSKKLQKYFPLTETQERFQNPQLLKNGLKTQKCEENCTEENKENEKVEFQGLNQEEKERLKTLKESSKLYALQKDTNFCPKKVQNEMNFKTTYNLSFDYHVKPQDFTLNTWQGEEKTQQIMQKTIKQIEEKTEFLKTLSKNEQKREKNYKKKELNFSSTFDKPHISIQFRAQVIIHVNSQTKKSSR